jgi:hypothetical protein
MTSKNNRGVLVGAALLFSLHLPLGLGLAETLEKSARRVFLRRVFLLRLSG